MADLIDWLRTMQAKGGKGGVDNVDARALGRVADELTTLRARIASAEEVIRPFALESRKYGPGNTDNAKPFRDPDYTVGTLRLASSWMAGTITTTG